jgi:hypothetical protein
MECRMARVYVRPVKFWSWTVHDGAKPYFEPDDGQRTYIDE